MTDPVLTGERWHFSSDCDANTFSLMRDASMDLVGLGSGNAAVLAHQVWFSIAVHVLTTLRG